MDLPNFARRNRWHSIGPAMTLCLYTCFVSPGCAWKRRYEFANSQWLGAQDMLQKVESDLAAERLDARQERELARQMSDDLADAKVQEAKCTAEAEALAEHNDALAATHGKLIALSQSLGDAIAAAARTTGRSRGLMGRLIRAHRSGAFAEFRFSTCGSGECAEKTGP